MPAVLGEKQFELGDVVFGWGQPMQVFSDGWTPGQAARSSSDEVIPNGDGVRFGVDRDGSATWGFKLFANETSEDGAWGAVGELGEVWGGDDHRSVPGAAIPLRYRVAGRTRRVYGRPRRWTQTPDNQSLAGRIDVTCDFVTVDHLVYDDELQVETLRLTQPRDPSQGFIFPVIFPVTSAGGSTEKVGALTVGGTQSTPVTLEFTGPVSGAAVTASWSAIAGRRQAGSWTAALVDGVLQDDPVTIDASPWSRSATRASGGGVRVSPRVTRISKMLLPPGPVDIVFTGTDPTGSARVEVSWRNAHRLPR